MGLYPAEGLGARPDLSCRVRASFFFYLDLRLSGESDASFDLARQLPNEVRIKKQRTLINQIKD